MILALILLVIVGLIVGGLARLLVPGPDPMGLFGTWLLGIVGSFVGGALGYLLFGNDLDDGLVQTAGFLGSIAGAVVALLVHRATARSTA